LEGLFIYFSENNMVHHLAKFDRIWLGRSLGTWLPIWGTSAVLQEHGAAAAAWWHQEALGIGEDVGEA
jgi:uncharacterized damage-inducible protein DinB